MGAGTETMHRTTTSSSSNHGGFFSKGGGIFGGSKTPTLTTLTTSTGFPTSHSGSTNSTANSRTSEVSSKSSASKSPRSSSRSKNNSSAYPGNSPKRGRNTSSAHKDEPSPLPESALRRKDSIAKADHYGQVAGVAADNLQSPASTADSYNSTTPYANMLVRPSTGHQQPSGVTPPLFAPMPPTSLSMETITYQHIQEMASKRISTLDYLRKAHEGRVYWFNTLLFNKHDLQRMPYFDGRKLARRATNYLLLGLSLPTILDLNGSNPQEFLKALNALLTEFEAFQQIHPPDGSTSLSRGRFPQMFKRTANGNKGRRASSAADIGLPISNDASDLKSISGSISAGGANSATSFAVSDSDLLPGEEYTYLLTPSLPFDPDFYETFATLCDVLIDCYTRLMSLVTSPRECNSTLAEMFTKADAKVRKIIVQGVVKEFEDSSRGGVKTEVAGVGKVVLGGLI